MKMLTEPLSPKSLIFKDLWMLQSFFWPVTESCAAGAHPVNSVCGLLGPGAVKIWGSSSKCFLTWCNIQFFLFLCCLSKTPSLLHPADTENKANLWIAQKNILPSMSNGSGAWVYVYPDLAIIKLFYLVMQAYLGEFHSGWHRQRLQSLESTRPSLLASSTLHPTVLISLMVLWPFQLLWSSEQEDRRNSCIRYGKCSFYSDSIGRDLKWVILILFH